MNHNALASEMLDHLSTQQIPNFEYGLLEVETQFVVQKLTNEIKTLMRRNSQDIIDIGQKLIEVKQHLGHGNFINWLKSEFNWSVSAATKFQQVAEQFKCVNFTNLNITASALYLIAAPSTPKEVRVEVLERASSGENISYTKAKAIVYQHRKTASLKSDKPVKLIEPTHYETSASFSRQEDLTEKKAQTETRALLSHESLTTVAFESKQIATTIKEIPEDTTQTPNSIENIVAVSHEASDTVLTEMVINIKNLTPEQLARVIVMAANTGLSEDHLLAIITASQRLLRYCQLNGINSKIGTMIPE